MGDLNDRIAGLYDQLVEIRERGREEIKAAKAALRDLRNAKNKIRRVRRGPGAAAARRTLQGAARRARRQFDAAAGNIRALNRTARLLKRQLRIVQHEHPEKMLDKYIRKQVKKLGVQANYIIEGHNQKYRSRTDLSLPDISPVPPLPSRSSSRRGSPAPPSSAEVDTEHGDNEAALLAAMRRGGRRRRATRRRRASRRRRVTKRRRRHRVTRRR